MKILHTSDWHLGQYFMMKTREAEHLAFLNWLITIVIEEKIDALIVAGDIFDSTTPPSYARKLYSDFIVKLQASGCLQLIIVSGNHDSVAVLNESKNLLTALNVSVLAGLSTDLQEHVITLKNKKEEKVIVCALPFLRAQDVMSSEQGISAEQKQLNLQQGIQQTYQKIYQLAKQKSNSLPVIATGHLTALGCSVSESVRDIYIGTLSAFPSSLFPDFDYIALGHLHRAQKVQKQDHIRYSGAPIALSFDEAKQDKQVLIAKFNSRGLVDVRALSIPNFQRLLVISGDLDSVTEQLTALLQEEADNKEESIWVEIKLQQAFYLSDVQTQFNTMVEDSCIEILKISSPQVNENSQWQETEVASLDALTPHQLFQHRIACEDNLSEQQQLELTNLFALVCAEIEEQL